MIMPDEFPSGPSRNVSQEELSAYQTDGVAVLRNILDFRWIERMRCAIESVLGDPGELSTEYTPKEKPGRFYIEYFIWRRHHEFRTFVKDSPMPELAAQVMRSKEISLFYDQLFVKEATTDEATPWHQDLSYWPLAGKDILSIWVPFDEVTRDTGGLVYIKGSHRWGKMFRPVGFSPGSEFDCMYQKVKLEELPDINSHIHKYELAHWDVSPGDVIIHHPLAVHCAGGNRSSTARRRALSLRYIGQDVRYDGRPGTFLQSPKLSSRLPPISFNDGDPIVGELFPRVWPRYREGA
jgi:ectoine hydroxylase-related dioxygenase (phytanoyl-CoA dioxygenase family)